jgi:predicted helicase
MTISQYLEKINTRYKTGISTEHTYRGDLQNLLESIATEVQVTNEPARIACGAPDYIVTRKGIPLGYIEAKDIGIDLHSKSLKEQFERYKTSLNNLIITDYLDFHLFIDGAPVTTLRIGRIENNSIVPLTENFTAFENLIKDFCSYGGQTIKSAKKLAEMMAGKSRMLATVIENALNTDEQTSETLQFHEADNTLKDQLNAFKAILIHDITNKEFADIYAQTIAYGMFAARLHDPTLDTFTRKEASELIPKSNPFLRKLFQYIAGYDLDTRIVWIVDALADIFRATDVLALLKNFGKSTQQNDPIIHFYETFLSEYDPKLRKARGVWYTPEPVVNFIVRAVDDILKTEFDLPEGLADTAKIKIKRKVQKLDERSKNRAVVTGETTIEEEVHRVQILDPATGTATFLAEVVKYIYNNKFEGQQGIWSNYVENHLLPRLNGFELLMASYAMAHLKLDMLLTETGYKPTKDQRFRIYLTNSLEEHHPDTGTLFANWLSSEANEANQIKRDTPVMCIIGNPPYSGTSSNMSDWILNLIEDYKDENEKKRMGRRWVQDDYVKFIRFSQFLIDKNGEGVLAFINPHGFLDNPTFSGMRRHLLKSFDKIYTIDLHGNTKKSETALDGSIDQNVFDIMQGVSINIFIKTGCKKNDTLGKVFHFDLFGRRESKYDFLKVTSLKAIDYNTISPEKPDYFFVPKNNVGKAQYIEGIKIEELFPLNTTGIVTAIDKLAIFQTTKDLISGTNAILNSSNPYNEFNIKDALQSSKEERLRELKVASLNSPTCIDYRPFDNRYIFYTRKTHGWLNSPRYKVMQHLINGENLGLMTCKQIAIDKWEHVGLTKRIADDSRVSNRTKERGYIFPLYLYADNSGQQTLDPSNKRTPNLKPEIVQQIEKGLGLTFTSEKETTKGTFAPIDILDYIYAVLHSPTYREKYKEFLKVDFPRVPYPKSKETFWQLVKLGGEIRQIHLLESAEVGKYITKYPIDGNNTVTKPKFENNRVWINETQYFDSVPEVAWNFYIGGYQPAQKWLKDRKDRTLDFNDILHYQKIIVALSATDRLMKEIDKIEIE